MTFNTFNIFFLFACNILKFFPVFFSCAVCHIYYNCAEHIPRSTETNEANHSQYPKARISQKNIASLKRGLLSAILHRVTFYCYIYCRIMYEAHMISNYFIYLLEYAISKQSQICSTLHVIKRAERATDAIKQRYLKMLSALFARRIRFYSSCARMLRPLNIAKNFIFSQKLQIMELVV